jgi:SAM-dependent methyltransferase
MLESEYEKMFRLEEGHWWFAAKRNYVRTVLDHYLDAHNLRVLDLGCGTGSMVALLKDYGRVFGMDSHLAACDYARRKTRAPLVHGDANHLPFKRASFDLVSAFDLLYHQGIEDDDAIIQEVHRLLSSRGFFLVTDSAFEFLRSRHDLAVMARHRYTLPELSSKMRKAGFDIVKKSYLFFMTFPAVMFSRLWTKLLLNISNPVIRSDLKPAHPVLNRLLKRLLILEGRFLQSFSLPWGSSLLILGRKV